MNYDDCEDFLVLDVDPDHCSSASTTFPPAERPALQYCRPVSETIENDQNKATPRVPPRTSSTRLPKLPKVPQTHASSTPNLLRPSTSALSLERSFSQLSFGSDDNNNQLGGESLPPPLPARPASTTSATTLPMTSSQHERKTMEIRYTNDRNAFHAPPTSDLSAGLLLKSSVKQMSLSGDFLATVGATGFNIWNIISGEALNVGACAELRVTAACFSTGSDPDNLSTRLWLGTHDGDLIVFDLQTMAIVERRLHFHRNGHLAFILASQMKMWSIDEAGSIYIWSNDDISKPATLECKPQCLRIASHPITAAIIADGRLWLSQGKRIEIYGESRHGQFELVAKIDTGNLGFAVSTAIVDFAYLPQFECDSSLGCYVYTAHEDGKVMAFGIQDLGLKFVYTTGVYRIHSIAAIGEQQIWIGFNTGKIAAIDVSDAQNWKIIAEWKAHSSAVLNIQYDTSRWTSFGSLTVASLAEGDVSFWDASFRVMNCRNLLHAQIHEYAEIREVDVLVCSWNVDAQKPPESMREEEFWKSWMTLSRFPEMIVFGLQEIMNLESKSANAKSILHGKSKNSSTKATPTKDDIRAKIWIDRINRAIAQHLPDSKYTLFQSQSMVGLLLIVYVRERVASRLRHVSVDFVKTGMGGYHGNKGAIALRFLLDDTSFCLLDCHLAAGQDHISNRNTDAAMIVRTASFPSIPGCQDALLNGGDGKSPLDHEHCFLFGDLNYRIGLPREKAIALIEERQLDELRKFDQLYQQHLKNPNFVLTAFEEGPLDFEPTYKFDCGTSTYDTSEKRRTPAWCDRILYRAPPSHRTPSEPQGAIIAYRSFDNCGSDHRPIAAVVRLKVKQIDWERRHVAVIEAMQKWHVMEKERIVRYRRLWYTYKQA